jgi:hypothetical protein
VVWGDTYYHTTAVVVDAILPLRLTRSGRRNAVSGSFPRLELPLRERKTTFLDRTSSNLDLIGDESVVWGGTYYHCGFHVLVEAMLPPRTRHDSSGSAEGARLRSWIAHRQFEVSCRMKVWSGVVITSTSRSECPRLRRPIRSRSVRDLRLSMPAEFLECKEGMPCCHKCLVCSCRRNVVTSLWWRCANDGRLRDEEDGRKGEWKGGLVHLIASRGSRARKSVSGKTERGEVCFGTPRNSLIWT